jgi:hypothetical protein
MANDDLHAIKGENMGRYYNIISGHNANIEMKLKEGCFYAMHATTNMNDLSLISLKMKEDSLFFEFKGNDLKVSAITEHGVFENFNKGKGKLLFSKNCHYIRLEVLDESSNLLITNPVLREMKNNVAISPFAINDFETMLYRMAVLCFTILLLFICFSKVTARVNYKVKDMIFRLSMAYT